MTASSPVTVRRLEGDLLHLELAAPPGNVLDARMVAALGTHVREGLEAGAVRAIVLSGAGRHFSFGASVEEHLPGAVRSMLQGFHELFRMLLRAGRPLVAAVQGQCLGGGLELAAFCQRLLVRPDATLGQPEIRLGVFAPVGSLVLPRRVGQAVADDLLLSGRTVSGTQAVALGLADDVADEPLAAALAYAREAFGRHSIASLVAATKAARTDADRAFLEGLERLERTYLEDLMALKDPLEGLTAFLEKRRPVWSHA